MRFFDFCSGIGTARMALESLGMSCVGHSEIDPKALQTYQLFFGGTEAEEASEATDNNWGDLMEIDPKELPPFDLLDAGFPCQTFSIVGKRAGMQDHRGLIIHGLVEMLEQVKPNFFLLENVKGLISHDSGRTLKEILRLLDFADYQVAYQVLKSSDFGVPQIRERVFLVGARKALAHKPVFPQAFGQEAMAPLENYLIDTRKQFNFDFNSKNGETFKNYLANKYNQGQYDLKQLLKQDYLILDTRQSDLRLYEGVVPTLRTGRHGILYVKKGKLRKLSGLEALLLQGVPKENAEKAESVPTTDLLSQAGNAMTVDVIRELGKQFQNNSAGV